LRLADTIVGVFVPIILVLGVGTSVYWAQHLPFDPRAVDRPCVLVVACPCAVGLAAPMATSLGIGRLARHGCLVRDPATLECSRAWRLIAFDKTGTLTSVRRALSPLTATAPMPTSARARRRAGTPLPNTAWPAPSLQRPLRADSSRSPSATFGSCGRGIRGSSDADLHQRPAQRPVLFCTRRAAGATI